MKPEFVGAEHTYLQVDLGALLPAGSQFLRRVNNYLLVT